MGCNCNLSMHLRLDCATCRMQLAVHTQIVQSAVQRVELTKLVKVLDTTDQHMQGQPGTQGHMQSKTVTASMHNHAYLQRSPEYLHEGERQRQRARTTLHADTRSYISIPASAKASDAAVIATAASEPPDSNTKQYTSTLDFGKVCRCTADCNAAWTVPETSRSSGPYKCTQAKGAWDR